MVSLFEVVTQGPNTAEEPFTMDDLGRDYFLRFQSAERRVVWFRCPATGDVNHSAAKRRSSQGRVIPGKRFCFLCNKCFSANNFHSQHLVNKHRSRAPTPPRAVSMTGDKVALA